MPPQEVGKIWTFIMDQFQDMSILSNDALFDLSLWNYFDFKSSRTNNSLEGWHHRLNFDLNHIIHPHFYMIIRAVQNNYAHNSAILSRHTATSTIPSRKKLFVNRNARLHDLENRYKQQTLTLQGYLEKVMRLIGIKKF
ncbi:unnamed protein product [Didymodactylos carnosus]|uniref:Uncharacterized protein n=1 Tax=Didymodactylos carnosus TaxID=1234261 RepID=A0A813THW8_9BILA|nr:unnamed protein product [Didymodactylos carnosus]CAF1353281.1 unnamed protein product [Didymodactylos carnosus]CAF3598695.1 unnamed protein product [Didymodactylos carnosus]CAF4163758.1 unnamed protein product [Didymodactylos carnosus]